MRTITYILGAVAGFFTLGGIGLIVKGYQVEGQFNNKNKNSIWSGL